MNGRVVMGKTKPTLNTLDRYKHYLLNIYNNGAITILNCIVTNFISNSQK